MTKSSVAQTLGENRSGESLQNLNENSRFAPNAAPMNPEKVSEMNMEGEGAPPKISKEMIAARANEIWIESGKTAGREQENWLQAEEDLRGRTTHHEFIQKGNNES